MQKSNVSKYLDNLTVYRKIWKNILDIDVMPWIYEYKEKNVESKLIVNCDLPELPSEHKYFKLDILARLASLCITVESAIVGNKRLVLILNKNNVNILDDLIDRNIKFLQSSNNAS